MNQYYRPYSSGFSLIPQSIKFIIIANVVIFILQNLLFNSLTIAGENVNVIFRDWFALQPIANESNSIFVSSFYPWQLITYQFMHGDFWHIFFNMFGVWMFGMELEQTWGSKKFIAYYLLCGIGAGLVQYFVADAPTIGASGSLFGLLAAFGFLYPDRKIFMFPLFFPIPARIFVIIYGAIELFSGFSNANSSVAHFAHVGGAVAGILLLKFGDSIGLFSGIERLFSKKSKSQNSSWEGSPLKIHNMNRREKEERVYEFREPVIPFAKKAERTFNISGEEINQSKIDAILDKISLSGYQSLSEKEKHILSELSKKI